MRLIRLQTCILLLLVAGTASAQTARRPFLFKDARSALATARIRGESDVLLLVAAMPGRNAAAAKTFTSMGGTLQYRDDSVDYLRGRLPVDQVEALASDPSVHSVSISVTPSGGGGGGNRQNTIAATDTANKRVWPPPFLSWYPIRNRYDPLGDLRALEWRTQNPTFDGRGVTLAIIDMSFDPLLPELQRARTLDGQPVPKIAGYQNALDSEEEPDGRWLEMKDTVRAANGQFQYEDRTYTAPRDGTFRIELLDEAVFDSLSRNGLDKDLNRDGNPEGSSRLFAVLWDGRTDDVWVDTDQDGSFTDETMLTDFRTRPEFGVFGTDDPVTPVRESVGFGVQIDKAKDLLAINAGLAGHASLVIGAAVGSRGERGRFDGVAPGARVYGMAEGCAAYGQTEAVIQALENPAIDLAWLEQCSNITRPYTLRDGRLTTTVIYERLIAKYGKPIIIPTHNYPVLGGTDDIVMAAGAIGIGGHESRENFFTNHGVRVEHEDNLLITGGYGPMGDGAFGADVISPSNYISTARGWEETRPIAGLYRLPPGYTIAGGTSTATPTAAGAVALLISAARQTGIKHDPFRIRQAVISSARWVPHLPAYKQGSGVLNVAGAWDVLKALDAAPDPVTITSRAPVRHSFSETLPTPNEGVGLYERGGWSVGQTGERVVTFTRTTGPRQPLTFAVNWTGNEDGTFGGPASVTLPLDRPVPMTVSVAPTSAGAHTAMLTLTNPTVPGYAHRMLATIVVGEPLTADSDFTVEAEVEVPRPEMRSFFYDVPAGADALRVDVAQPSRDVAVAIVRPDTRTANATRVAPSSGGRGGFGGGRSSRVTYVVTDPMPGVWEVRLTDIADVSAYDAMQAEKDEPVPPTPATLTVSAIAVEPQPSSATDSDGAGDGPFATQALSLTNRMASFTGALAGATMGAARRERPTIHQGEQLEYEIEVTEGSNALLVEASSFSAADADLDIYLFDCTGDECRSPQTDSDPVGAEIVTVQNPAAGTWKVVIDGARIPSGSTTFSYLDVVFNPSWGATVVPEVSRKHEQNEAWTTQAHTWLAGDLPAGRTPFAAVSLEGRLSGGLGFGLGLIELSAVGKDAGTPRP